MKDFLIGAARWMTDGRRQALQAVIASATSLLVILGAVSDVQSSALLDLSASGLLALQGALGLFLLRPGDRYTWLNTTGRGVIYSLGGAIGVVGFTFSLWSDSTSSLIVQVATVLASILVGAVQMVNAGTLSAQPEASSATFAKEREPEWVAPLPALHVGVFWPGLPHVERDEVGAAARALIGPALGSGSSIRIMTSATEFRGVSLDVVLVTVPLTRALVEVFEPNVAASVYPGARVQYLEVA